MSFPWQAIEGIAIHGEIKPGTFWQCIELKSFLLSSTSQPFSSSRSASKSTNPPVRTEWQSICSNVVPWNDSARMCRLLGSLNQSSRIDPFPVSHGNSQRLGCRTESATLPFVRYGDQNGSTFSAWSISTIKCDCTVLPEGILQSIHWLHTLFVQLYK